jgi:aminoglycoside phosphotransferase (APT) family kinase protein
MTASGCAQLHNSCLLHKQVPVPKAWCLCQDASVVGTPFYVMSFISGRVYDDLALPGMQPADRYQVGAQGGVDNSPSTPSTRAVMTCLPT